MRLACILDDEEVETPGSLEDGIHVGHLPIQMHRHHSLDWLPRPTTTWSAGYVVQGTPFEVCRQCLGIHERCVFIDVDELDLRSGLADRLNGRDESMGH